MQGVITQVDIAQNSATLVDDTQKSYEFSLDDCVGFEEYPSSGERVSFELTDGEIFFVEPFQAQNEQVDAAQEPQDYIVPKEKTLENIEIKEHIPLSKSVQKCLDGYFDHFMQGIYGYQAEFEDYEDLDYLRMKRFLQTAFNNLKDMDSSFMDDELVDLYHDLKEVEKVYVSFRQKRSHPQIAYEQIFLAQQDAYIYYAKRQQANSRELTILKSNTKTLEEQIKQVEREILATSQIEVRQKKSKDLKRYKKYYVDALHKMASIRDENILLNNAVVEFESKYEAEFTRVYEAEALEYDVYLKRQLDGYAYEFDRRMWERAETSTAIRTFFKNANIEDDYSSKTFLKYFIKTLDESKYSKEHKKLSELLEYLQSRAKMRLLIISEEHQNADKIKHIIRQFDKEYNVEKSDKPRSSYYRKDLRYLDFIFADFSMLNPPVSEFLDMMQKRIIQAKSKAELCLFSNTFTKEGLALLKKRNIKHIIATNVPESRLQEHLKQIINPKQKG